MKLIFAAALVIGTAVTGTSAQDTKPKKVKVVDPNKKVCRRDDNSASRLATQTCRTQAEWDAMRQENRDTLENDMRAMAGSKQ